MTTKTYKNIDLGSGLVAVIVQRTPVQQVLDMYLFIRVDAIEGIFYGYGHKKAIKDGKVLASFMKIGEIKPSNIINNSETYMDYIYSNFLSKMTKEQIRSIKI